MKQITTADDIKSLGTIMGVWAHPDDETFTSGGLFSTAIKNGQTVIIVTATKGEWGIQDELRWPQLELANIRTKELAAALNLMGITEHHWLGYEDGHLKKVDEHEAIDRIRVFIDQYKPDTIITFGTDGLTGHEDHKIISKWANGAANYYRNIRVFQVAQLNDKFEKIKEADKEFNIFFHTQPATFSPEDCDMVFELPEDTLHLKYLCLQAMPSQYEAMLKHFGKDKICEMLGTEAFRKSL